MKAYGFFRLSTLIVSLLLLVLAAYHYFKPIEQVEFIDKRTGLIWQFCSAGSYWSASGCGGEAALFTWREALLYCSGLDGVHGWRLPSRNELLGLVDWGKRTPSVPEQLTASTKNNIYWSSTTSWDEPEKAFYVSMFSGYSYANKKIVQGFVRCVKVSG